MPNAYEIGSTVTSHTGKGGVIVAISRAAPDPRYQVRTGPVRVEQWNHGYITKVIPPVKATPVPVKPPPMPVKSETKPVHKPAPPKAPKVVSTPPTPPKTVSRKPVFERTPKKKEPAKKAWSSRKPTKKG